ncbi:Cadherin-12 [Nibea albiflora]|uniref:Cadherin-12 n=1 Tax=Nibea albiflora TaxID=240163 RepID=A0ACB7FIQ4_NIBAL|nr:Cadherin-12 [Nibea albiflora]
MITREYVTLFLVGSCFLLDYSSQISLQAPLQSKTKAGVMSVREGKGGKTARTPLGETPLTPLESRKRLRRHGRPRIHRIKRGWVWNQFFVLEEYMGSEPQYVGKHHLQVTSLEALAGARDAAVDVISLADERCRQLSTNLLTKED